METHHLTSGRGRGKASGKTPSAAALNQRRCWPTSPSASFSVLRFDEYHPLFPTQNAIVICRYHQRQKEKRAEYEAQLRDVAQQMEKVSLSFGIGDWVRGRKEVDHLKSPKFPSRSALVWKIHVICSRHMMV